MAGVSKFNLAADVRKQYDAGKITRDACNFKLSALLSGFMITPEQFGDAYVKPETQEPETQEPETQEPETQEPETQEPETQETLNSMGLF